MTRFSIRASVALMVACVAVASARPALGEELFELTASDAAAEAYFGSSVAISGNTAIIGAVGDGHAGWFSGAAYLFDMTTGQERFKLTASDAAAGDNFGESVGISGNSVIVGALHTVTPTHGSIGSAYVFNANTGQERFKLFASDGPRNGQFGNSVGVSGNTAIVGAWADGHAGDYAGSAYLFDVTTGQELMKLIASDAAAHNAFGNSVAVDGNRALVGSPGTINPNGLGSSSAYLFDVGTGQELMSLHPPTPRQATPLAPPSPSAATSPSSGRWTATPVSNPALRTCST